MSEIIDIWFFLATYANHVNHFNDYHILKLFFFKPITRLMLSKNDVLQ